MAEPIPVTHNRGVLGLESRSPRARGRSLNNSRLTSANRAARGTLRVEVPPFSANNDTKCLGPALASQVRRARGAFDVESRSWSRHPGRTTTTVSTGRGLWEVGEVGPAINARLSGGRVTARWSYCSGLAARAAAATVAAARSPPSPSDKDRINRSGKVWSVNKKAYT